MTNQQVLMWCNSLLKQFSLQIRASDRTYHLDLLGLIKCKNAEGKLFFDHMSLVTQVVRLQAPVDSFLECGVNAYN
jgi:hypothetical protein